MSPSVNTTTMGAPREEPPPTRAPAVWLSKELARTRPVWSFEVPRCHFSPDWTLLSTSPSLGLMSATTCASSAKLSKPTRTPFLLGLDLLITSSANFFKLSKPSCPVLPPESTANMMSTGKSAQVNLSTGTLHSCKLQRLRCMRLESSSAGQTPKPAGGRLTCRKRVCVPPPQAWLQWDHFVQAASSQSRAQAASAVQERISTSSGQGTPPWLAWVVTTRVRSWMPLSQAAEHIDQPVQAPT
mmetsp:Transcript_37522/g.107843  ORF Transcript_37522/g.107843 Transcript_37522/m.107843 type:complete len:242 (+) Transcript_37522:310-1035(+)